MMGESGVNNINIQSQNLQNLWTVERGEDETTLKSIHNRQSSDKIMFFSESKFFDLHRLNSYNESNKNENLNLQYRSTDYLEQDTHNFKVPRRFKKLRALKESYNLKNGVLQKTKAHSKGRDTMNEPSRQRIYMLPPDEKITSPLSYFESSVHSTEDLF